MGSFPPFRLEYLFFPQGHLLLIISPSSSLSILFRADRNIHVLAYDFIPQIDICLTKLGVLSNIHFVHFPFEMHLAIVWAESFLTQELADS